MVKLVKFSRTTLRGAVVEQLRSSIDDGSIVSGTHLAEVDLSQRLGVSRATLREALRELQQDGLLVQDERGRVSVRTLDERQIRDLFDVRTSLEQLAVERLCTVDDRARIVAVLRARLDAMARAESVPEGVRADLQFHEELCIQTGNETLMRSWSNIGGLIRMTMVSSGMVPAQTNMSAERHAPIVDGIAAGDQPGTRAFLNRHMEEALFYLLEARRSEIPGP